MGKENYTEWAAEDLLYGLIHECMNADMPSDYYLELRDEILRRLTLCTAEKDYPHRKVTCMKCDYVNKFTLVSDFTAADAKRWEEQS